MKQLNYDCTVVDFDPTSVHVLEFDGSLTVTVPTTDKVLIRTREFSDGRIFSLVEQLRHNGYSGKIILSGIGCDQCYLAFGVNADAVLLPDGAIAEEWQQAASFITGFYGPRARQARANNIIEARHDGH